MERPNSIRRNPIDSDLAPNEARRSHAYGGVGTWRWDALTNELMVEPETEQLYGAPPGTIRDYRDWTRRLAPDDVRRFESERDAAIAARRPFKIEFSVRLPGGDQRWILTRGRGEYDQQGRLLRLLGVDIDITDQMRSELNVRFLDRVQAELAHAQGEEALIHAVLNEVGRHLDVPIVVYVDANESDQSVTVRHTLGEAPPGVLGVHLYVDYAVPGVRERFLAGDVIAVEDVATDARTAEFAQNYLRFDVSAFVAVPFRAASGFKGALAIAARQPRGWRRDEIQVLRDLVARLFPGIEGMRAEVKLRESQTLLADVLEQLPIGVGVVDAGGRVQLANADLRRYSPNIIPSFDAARVHRWRAHDADGQPVPPAQWPGPRALSGEAVSPGMEFVYTDDEGREHWLLVSAVPFQRRAAQAHAIVIVQDIGKRKQAEAALRESEERFRAMADDTPIIIWVTDASGRVRFVNRAFREFFGTTLEAIEREGWRPLFHPDDYKLYTRAFARAFAGRRPFRAPSRLRRRDGEWRWLDSYAKPRFSVAGEFLGFAGSSPDVTDQKQAEAALYEADRRKTEFLAMLAHELRNPLAPIRNAVQIMKRRISGDPVLEASRDLIDRQVMHMVRLIDDLMDVNRITRGKLELRKERVELREVIEGARESCARQIADAAQTLTVSLPPEPICLEGDRARLAQVFANLLDNASKYSDRGGTISVTAERRDTRARVSVRDAGVGIPPDRLEEIFDLFAQVDRTLARAKPGLGIGLSLVRQLVELHGGSVGAFSEGVGRGSEFVVELPALARDLPPEQAATVPERTQPATRHRLLIADDNADSAQSLATLLRIMGNEVWIAYDGFEAIQLAERHHPEAVLLDIGMPKLDGYEVCRRIRAAPWGRDMTLIAVTGFGQQEDREKSRDAGFEYHLVKPIDEMALMRLLARRGSSEPSD